MLVNYNLLIHKRRGVGVYVVNDFTFSHKSYTQCDRLFVALASHLITIGSL